MSEDHDPRRPGRPRNAEPGSRVSMWIPERDHDRLIRLARAKRMSVSEFLRRSLQPRVRDR